MCISQKSLYRNCNNIHIFNDTFNAINNGNNVQLVLLEYVIIPLCEDVIP